MPASLVNLIVHYLEAPQEAYAIGARRLKRMTGADLREHPLGKELIRIEPENAAGQEKTICRSSEL